MSRKWKIKQEQKPRRKGRLEPLEVNESVNAFITLNLGKEAFEGLLSTSTAPFLRWIARNTLLAIHAEDIRGRYPGVNSDIHASGESSAETGGKSERISGSAAAGLPSTYADSQDVSAGGQVSLHPIPHL